MIVKLRSWWQQIKHHAFLATGILVALLVLMTFIFFAYRFGWSGTGFLNKTLWDWLQLLIIPVVLATAALLFNLATTRTEQRIAAKRYEQDKEIALDKQREDLLQTYLDRMAELLLKEQLRSSAEDAEVRHVAQARTLTVIPQLDGKRKGSLMKFLSESKLLEIISWDDADFDLSGADLGYFNFSGLDLGEVNLSGADLGDANLSGANLSKAYLNGTILWYANLRGAQVTEEQLKTAKSLRGAIMPDGSKYDPRSKREDVVRLLQQAGGSSRLDLRNRDLKDTDLSGLDLHNANLSYANLFGADLHNADLRGADLRGADLRGADLRGADLRGANLNEASLWNPNLRGDWVTEEPLKTAKSLKGAIMPDGSKHP